ncbi:hypothetical protein KY285_030465 [Solanum tuberosum]|nr:hypothetical protein KY285_030465 [Solanum tuberosum]
MKYSDYVMSPVTGLEAVVFEAMLTENFLRSKKYWGLVENGIPAAPDAMTYAQQKNVDDQKTSKDIWDSMKQKYEGNTRVKRAQLQSLHKEFETLHMKAGEIVNEYFGRTLTIANKLKANGEDKGDIGVVEKILRSMTSKFNYVVCPIKESKDTSTLIINELQRSLLVHEQRLIPLIEDEHALKIYLGKLFGGRGRSFGRGGRGRGKGRFDKATVECYNCHKLGHFQRECPQNGKEENYAKTQEEMLLMAYVDNADKENTWYLDSGCNNHMCGNREYFFDFDGSFKDSVKSGNNLSLSVVGKGNIRLQI